MWEDGSPGKPAVGGLGFVVWFPPGHPLAGPGGRFFFSARNVGLSELTFLDRDHSLIGQLELLAAAAVYVSLPHAAFHEQDVIHYIDNSSALYGMTKGYSQVRDTLAIIRAFHAANLALRANVWFNYVTTKANVADLPRSLGGTKSDDALPKCPPIPRGTKEALAADGAPRFIQEVAGTPRPRGGSFSIG